MTVTDVAAGCCCPVCDSAVDDFVAGGVDGRAGRYGQADHVRFYGNDVNDRLTAAGLQQGHGTGSELLGTDLAHRLGLHPPEVFWLVWKRAAA